MYGSQQKPGAEAHDITCHLHVPCMFPFVPTPLLLHRHAGMVSFLNVLFVRYMSSEQTWVKPMACELLNPNSFMKNMNNLPTHVKSAQKPSSSLEMEWVPLRFGVESLVCCHHVCPVWRGIHFRTKVFLF